MLICFYNIAELQKIIIQGGHLNVRHKEKRKII
nr:MAG TPA: hypothetical protein [Caudoviricetes sp.]